MRLNLTVIVCLLTMLFSNAQNDRILEYADGKIHIKTFGSGDPILIINGGPGMNSEGFGPLAQSLSDNHQTIIYDQRGTGQSEIGTIDRNSMTIDKMVEDIEVIREQLHFSEWIVMGHSFGGMLASYYTSKHPEKVKALILSSSGGVDLSLLNGLDIRSGLSETQRDSLNCWTRRISSGDTSQFARLQRGKYLAPAYLYNDEFVDAIAERLTQGNMAINSLIWQNMKSMDFDCKNGLKTFDQPVLIIQGKHDIIGQDIANNTHALFKNSTLTFIDKAAHYGCLENPEDYFGAIHRFLEVLE